MLVQCTGLRNTGLISVPEHSMFTPFFVSRLEQRNKVLQGEVAGLHSTLEQQRRWVSVAEIKMRNVERARADADKRNTTLQHEMEQFFETFGKLNAEARKTSRIVQSFWNIHVLCYKTILRFHCFKAVFFNYGHGVTPNSIHVWCLYLIPPFQVWEFLPMNWWVELGRHKTCSVLQVLQDQGWETAILK